MTATEVYFLTPYSEGYKCKERMKSHKMDYWLELVFKVCLLPYPFQKTIPFWYIE